MDIPILCTCGHSFRKRKPMEGGTEKCFKCGKDCDVPIYKSLVPIDFIDEYLNRRHSLEVIVGQEPKIDSLIEVGLDFLRYKFAMWLNDREMAKTGYKYLGIPRKIECTCPKCKTKFLTTDNFLGKDGYCPNCDRTFLI